MNRDPDFDQTLVDWLDEGADRAPERFVWAALEDVERTAQRGAWRASTEDLFMHLKFLTPVLGVAAALALAIVAYQVFGAPDIGIGDRSPRTYTSEDLPSIILTEDNVPEDVTVDLTGSGEATLRIPLRAGGPIIDTTGFVDALNTELTAPTGLYGTWAAVFETEEDAQRAFEFIANEHESPDGWGLQASIPDSELGDESRVYTGPMYEFESAQTIFWRKGNLLLAAIGVVDWDFGYLRSIADGMDARAR